MMSRADSFYSLGLMPTLMGLGHVVSSIGAIQTATGSYRFPIRLLGLIGSLSAVVDSMDTYKDIPVPRRPSKWIWHIWLGVLWFTVLTCTFLSGLSTAIDMYRFLPLGLLWGIPCIPFYSDKRGIQFVKPKTLLFEAKSLVVAVSMANVCADASMAYYCRQAESTCTGRDCRRRSFLLAVLYEFLRETSCDARDIAEDTREGLQTLPVKLGKRRTVVCMAIIGMVLDPLLTRGLTIAADGLIIHPTQLTTALLRVVLTMLAYWQVLRYPRCNIWAWGSMSLFGLVPVLWAQAELLKTDIEWRMTMSL